MKTRPSARQCFDACLNTALDERAPGRRRRALPPGKPSADRGIFADVSFVSQCYVYTETVDRRM